MSKNLPTLPGQPLDRDLIKLIAMDIGTEVQDFIERMYPEAVKATSSTFLFSVRNSIYNQIIAALDITDEKEIRNRLVDRKVQRWRMQAIMKSCRGSYWEAVRAAVDVTEGG